MGAGRVTPFGKDVCNSSILKIESTLPLPDTGGEARSRLPLSGAFRPRHQRRGLGVAEGVHFILAFMTKGV